MFLGLLVFGTFWFWLLILSVCVALTFAVEHSRPGWAALAVLGTLSLLGTLGDINVFRLASQHPIQALECVGAYVLVGSAWSVIKWWFYVSDARERFDNAKNKWFIEHRPYGAAGYRFTDLRIKAQLEFDTAASGDATQLAKANLDTALKNEADDKFRAETNMQANFNCYAKDHLIPSVRREKARIMTWMIWWPWSAVWTLINNPIKRVFTIIYNKLRIIFDDIVKSAFKDIDLN